VSGRVGLEMRYLFIDTNYPAFLESIYRDRPNLASAPYEEQLAAIREGMFGEAEFQASALRELGHQADVIVPNAHAAQRAWATEHGVPGLARGRWNLRLRRGAVPWLSRPRPEISWELILQQVREHRPDVVYVGIMGTLPSSVAAQMRRLTRLLVGQVATELPPGQDYGAYDLVVSALPSLVQWFRDEGMAAEWLPLAFGPAALAEVPVAGRDIPASFVGSFGQQHPGRRELMETVASTSPLQIWTGDLHGLPADSPIRGMLKSAAWGRGMYEVLARSRITLNHHGAVAGPYAANLRLYEATGMGALLVTDAKSNLSDLFKVGSEVVSYASPQECAGLVSYYLGHPGEASKIATAGQARTLRDHTWHNRMDQLVRMIETRL